MPLVDQDQVQASAPDETLVRAAQRHDAEAFGQLYDRYFDRVHSYLSFALRDPGECEDLAAQVFLEALASLSSYRGEEMPFSAWLFRSARTLMVEHLRRRPRRQLPGSDGRPPELRAPADPSLASGEEAARETLVQAAASLTPLQQQVMALRFAAGLASGEVAAVMGKPEGAVRALQHAALNSLGRHYAFPSGGRSVA